MLSSSHTGITPFIIPSIPLLASAPLCKRCALQILHTHALATPYMTPLSLP